MRLNEPRFATPELYNYTLFRQHVEMGKKTGCSLEFDWFDYLTRIVGISLAWILCLQIIIFKLLACLRLDFEDRLHGYKFDGAPSKSKTLDMSKELEGPTTDQTYKSNELVTDKLSYQPIIKRWKQQYHTDITQKTGSTGSRRINGMSMDMTSMESTSPTQTSTNHSLKRNGRASKEMITTPQKAKRGSQECMMPTQKSSNLRHGSAEVVPLLVKTNKFPGSPEYNMAAAGNKKHPFSRSREAITQESPRNRKGSQESVTPVNKPRGSREAVSQESNNKKKGASPKPLKLTRTQSVGNTTDGEKTTTLTRAKKGFNEKELQHMEHILDEKTTPQKGKEMKK